MKELISIMKQMTFFQKTKIDKPSKIAFSKLAYKLQLYKVQVKLLLSKKKKSER